MENEFKNKVENSIKKFEGKSVKVTISGIIESKFYMKNLKYVIEESILTIKDGDNSYLEMDIDDIENLYLEFIPNGYALLVLNIGRDIHIEIQTKEDNIVSIRERIWEGLVKAGLADELYKEVCGA